MFSGNLNFHITEQSRDSINDNKRNVATPVFTHNNIYSPVIIKKSSTKLENFELNTKSSKSKFSENALNKHFTPSPHIFAKKDKNSDRYIPSNKGLNLLEQFELTASEDKEQIENDNNDQNLKVPSLYNQLLRSNILGEENFNSTNENKPNAIKSKIFKFQSEQKQKKSQNSIGIIYQNLIQNEEIEEKRKIPKNPYKLVEAPGIIDDFYLNLIDWSSTNNIAYGIKNSVYLWSASRSSVSKLFSYQPDNSVCSLIWNKDGNLLATGDSRGMVDIWDVEYNKKVRCLEGHSNRVGVVAWNKETLSSGSKDYSILNRDIRCPEHYNTRLNSHKQEVCGLKWSFDETQLASGGNDNKLMIWNNHSTTPLAKFSQHSAAVKALAWSPHQSNLLASGGGTADRCIRFWNTTTLAQSNFVDTGSQVCNLVFSKNSNELVSTHGYSLNQIICWKLPDMSKVGILTGHTYRVLYLGMSPCGQNIVTGAGDESLRMWNVFPPSKRDVKGSLLFPSNKDIR